MISEFKPIPQGKECPECHRNNITSIGTTQNRCMNCWYVGKKWRFNKRNN